jgi:hypothetical protein
MNLITESMQLLQCENDYRGYPCSNSWKDYIRSREKVYRDLMPRYLEQNMRSEANWVTRRTYGSGEEIGIHVTAGDICWIDFGQSYLNEMGYQHFGLVMSVCNRKALVISLTSNPAAWKVAGDPFSPSRHLMRIGKPKGLMKDSTLFLNDSRWINTARVIHVRSHIDPESELFRRIRERMNRINNGEEPEGTLS